MSWGRETSNWWDFCSSGSEGWALAKWNEAHEKLSVTKSCDHTGVCVCLSNLSKIKTRQTLTFSWSVSLQPRAGQGFSCLSFPLSFYSSMVACHQDSIWVFNLSGTAASAQTRALAHLYAGRAAGVAEGVWCGFLLFDDFLQLAAFLNRTEIP